MSILKYFNKNEESVTDEDLNQKVNRILSESPNVGLKNMDQSKEIVKKPV